MKNITNILLLVTLLLVGGLYLKKSSVNYTTTTLGGVSSAGATSSTADEYSVIMAPSTDAATTTSILNTDGTDREITSSVVACTSLGNSFTFQTGAPLANFNVRMSTSTVAGGLQANTTNLASNITIATTSAWFYLASTTEPNPTYVGRVWPSGTYLNILFNATNTATCTVGVRALGL